MYNDYKFEENKEKLDKLIHVTSGIYDTYFKKNVNKDYFDMLIEEENKIYKELNSNKSNYHKLCDILNGLILSSNYSDEEKSFIGERIDFHLSYLGNLMPFTSNRKKYYKREVEDYNTIITNINHDFYTNLIYLYNEIALKTKSKSEKITIEKEMNEITFCRKFLEQADYSKIIYDSKNRLLAFNHDKEFVDELYEEFVSNILNATIEYCSNYTDENIKSSRNARTDIDIDIATLKASLYLFDSNELSMILLNYYKLLNNDKFHNIKEKSSISIERITLAIKEVVLDKNQNQKKVKQKSVVKKLNKS